MKRDCALCTIDGVTAEVDARTENRFLVFLWCSFELVSGGKLQPLRAIDLHGVIPVRSEDDEAMRVLAVVGYDGAVREQLFGFGESPRADNVGGLC